MKRKLKESKVMVNGVKIAYYDIAGKKPDLLILHGWAHAKEGWRDTALALGGNFRTVIIDLPGFGSSGKPHVRYSLDFFLATITAFCRRIRLDLSRSYLLGHSFGGTLALALSARVQPKKMILVAPPILPVPVLKVLEHTGPLPEFLSRQARKSDFFLNHAAQLMVNDPSVIDQVIIDAARKPTDWSNLDTLKTLGSIDLQEALLYCGPKTLLIYGTKDRLVPPAQYNCMKGKKHPNVQRCPVAGSGHMPFLEKRKKFLDECNAFLAR